jgi:hypothetical protein
MSYAAALVRCDGDGNSCPLGRSNPRNGTCGIRFAPVRQRRVIPDSGDGRRRPMNDVGTPLANSWAAMMLLVGIMVGILSGCDGMSSTSHDSAQISDENDRLDVNKVAAFKQQVTWQRSEANGTHHLLVHFTPTDGTWRPGEALTFQIRLKQPCDSWRISGGFDELDETISGSKTNTTEINVSTRSAPRPGEDVVIDVQGGTPPAIDQVAMSPREQDHSAGR